MGYTSARTSFLEQGMNSLANFGNLFGIDGLIIGFCMLMALAIAGAIVFAAIMLAQQKRTGSGGAPMGFSAPGQRPLRICDNCGRQIGNLEQTYIWKETHAVCTECYSRLQAQG
jgi:hypothetical protein